MFYSSLDTHAFSLSGQIFKTLQAQFGDTHTLDTMIGSLKQSQLDHEYVD